MLLDPDRAVLAVLLLPDGHDGLQLVDRVARGLERGVAMWRARDDDDRDLADGQIADAVMHHEPARRVLLLETVGDLLHLLFGHLGVGLVFEVRDLLAAARVAHRTEERGHATPATVGRERDSVVHRQLHRRDEDEREAHATGDRRDERDLVAVRERLLRRDVVAVLRDDDLPSLGDERMATGDLGDRVADRGAGWEIEVDPALSRSLAIRREKAYLDTHDASLCKCENEAEWTRARPCRPYSSPCFSSSPMGSSSRPNMRSSASARRRWTSSPRAAAPSRGSPRASATGWTSTSPRHSSVSRSRLWRSAGSATPRSRRSSLP